MVVRADRSSQYAQLHEIGVSLSHEQNIVRLLETILLAAKAMVRADGATLYRMQADRRALRFEILRTDSLKLAFGGLSGVALPEQFADVPLYDEAGAEDVSRVAACCALKACTVSIADAYTAEGFDFSGTRDFDAATGYRSQSFLTVPMLSHENEVIGVLQLINAIDPVTGAVGAFTEDDRRIAESLASQAAVALTNRLLADQLETLFESFITLINLAIDEKSPYTGGHCERVPALTMMLAEAAAAMREGPLADFALSDKDRYELKMAGLLHDCGKVTTPVHVVDKATKLQTIYDRIGLIDTRFEVLRRDAEIAMLRAVATGQAQAVAQAALEENWRALDADRAFLRAVNRGSEAMAYEDMVRVRQIAGRYRWRNAAGEDVPFLTDEEVENLCIRHGTLNRAERETINHHIVATNRMLEALPWPRHLKNVPRYAGGHHERMDGRGYPKGLRGSEMPVQARIMAIADIFEALTARDRPYKPGMKLSEALRVLERFSRNGHIDPDLYAVFVRQKVYLDYACRYLDPEQIDVLG